MNFSRALVSSGVLTLGLTLVGGCTGKNLPDAKHDKSVSSSSSQKVSETRNKSQPFQLPIEEYAISPDDYYLIDRAKSDLINQCMRRFGSAYVDASPMEPIFQASRRYGITDLETAKDFGYHMPKVRKKANGHLPKIGTKDRIILFGPGADEKKSINGKKLPDGGCSGEADSTISGGRIPESVISLAQTVDVQSFRDSQRDPAFISANKKWADCMAGSGYRYSSPLKAIADPVFQETSLPTEEEKRVAVKDVKCKISTNLMGVWSGIEGREQSRVISENSGRLSELKSFQKSEISRARKVLSMSP